MQGRRSGRERAHSGERIAWLMWIFASLGVLVILRLGYLQVMEHGTYSLLASDQHDLATKLLPTRGQILIKDKSDGALHPLATNKLAYLVYAVPREMKDAVAVAHALATTLALPDVDLVTKLTKRPNSAYELIAKDVAPNVADQIREQHLEGVGFIKTTGRLYPEELMSGQLIGFVSQDAKGGIRGQYGIEGSFEEELAGTPGSLIAEKDASGRRLAIGTNTLIQAKNGSDIVLTIDRSIQFKACSVIQAAVERHRADGGSIVIMNPQTGAIIAMCSSPDFSPAEYSKISDLNVLNNPATFTPYEPGSIFKPVTLAAGIDAEKITPKTTYVDKGVEEIDDFKIKNSDGQTRGVQTMTQVLDESLNTGTIFVQRQLGKELFKRYVEAFGFGTTTQIELVPEAKGNIKSLEKKGSIYAATASFGQGITTTPVQMVASFAALSNGGRLMRPYIVDEIIHPDGTRERTKPLEVRRPISSRASRLITGMLTSAVENGHGKQAGVPGYWVAGKTGTAQVPRTDGLGYQKDVTIGSFAGYAPASDPKFVMLVKIDHPRDVQWAEESAGPVFGEMAKFLLTYLQVPPERTAKPPPPPPPTAASTTPPTTTH